METEALKAEIADLERILKKRRGRSGFNDNVTDIEVRLADLRSQLAEADSNGG